MTTYPGGQTLTSSALTVPQINQVVQPIFAQMLGIDPATDPNVYSKVRISWQTQGQPAQSITDDILYLRCVETGSDYERIRDHVLSQLDSATLTANYSYTRRWTIYCAFYGPNSFDNARAVRSAMFLDTFLDLFAASNLYADVDLATPVRVPELFDGQWWERIDFQVQFNEHVAESLTVPSVASVEILTSDKNGVQSDLVVNA